MKLNDEEKIFILAMKFKNEKKIWLKDIIKSGYAKKSMIEIRRKKHYE